jgi:hypothetical protein
MSDTTTAGDDCRTRTVREPRAVRNARKGAIRLYARMLLGDGPATARELAKRMPYVPAVFVYGGGVGCRADDHASCGGHLQPLSWWEVRTSDVTAELHRLERDGVTSRVVLAGTQAHLWSLT